MKTILIADDEPNIRTLIETTLEGPDYRLLLAADGPAALEVALRDAPDLIILDWMMPGLSGPEVLQALQRDGRTAGIPVILLTARDQEKDRSQGLALGAHAYLAKPFSPLALMRTIQEATARQGLRRRPDEGLARKLATSA